MSGIQSTTPHAYVTSRPGRRIILAAAALLAMIPVIAGGQPVAALEPAEARHLLARTGFGLPSPRALDALAPLSRGEAVDTLLSGIRTAPRTQPPEWTGHHMPSPKTRKAWSKAEKQSFNKTNRQRLQDLQQWWIGEMLATPSPFTERLVLFWHNHFTSSFDAVKWTPYLYQQNARFRRHGAGDFKVLLREMVTDPAMLFYLDGRRNRAKKPNENFSRELLELFTMGEGQGYTERDIQEAARALSGWSVDFATSRAVFKARHHDKGEKAFLGRTGPWTADDIVAILLAHPRVAGHVAERLHRALIGGQPRATTLDAAAAAFRRADYQIKPLLRVLLTSPDFWSPANRGTLIKSPVDLVVGLARLASWQGETKILANRMRGMGQQLFRPPNVKGWPGGSMWITATSLTARNGFTYAMAKVLGRGETNSSGMGMMAKAVGDGAAIMAGPRRSQQEVETALLAVPPIRTLPVGSLSPAAHLRAVLRDPAFQMK